MDEESGESVDNGGESVGNEFVDDEGPSSSGNSEKGENEGELASEGNRELRSGQADQDELNSETNSEQFNPDESESVVEQVEFDPNEADEEIESDQFDPNEGEEKTEENEFDPNKPDEEIESDQFDPNEGGEKTEENEFDPNETYDDIESLFDPNDYREEGIGAEKNDPAKEKGKEKSEESYHENIGSQSTSTVIVAENKEKVQELGQEELEKEVEKELEEGIEAINKYLEEEAEFINAYQEMVAEARELEKERESKGEESHMSDEEWKEEVETAAYTAEQLYESMKEIETKTKNEKISEINEETEYLKEQEGKEEAEAQTNNLKEESSELYEEVDERKEELEQHQVEGFIEEELETEPEPIVSEEEIEKLQEMDLEKQFHTVHFNDLISDLYEKQEEEVERLKEQEEKEEAEAQANNLKEESSELYEELNERIEELEQHQVEGFIEEELEIEPEPIVNEEEIEKLQEMELEKQFHTVHFNDLINELYEKQEEEKNKEEEKELEKENIQEIKHQSTCLQEKLEEQEQELELDYEEKDEVEQHQVEVAIEEELETEPEPIINEDKLEHIKNLEPEKQLAAELFYELIEELTNKQNEEQEEQEEISTEQKVAQIKSELEISQELNSGETEVEANSQEAELEQGTASPDKEVEEHTEVEENRDHQQELEEILEQYRKIEQEALVEIEQEEEENSEKTAEKKIENAKKLYAQQTGKRPIYANKETKGFKQWLEQKKESEEKEKTKQKQEPKAEQKKEESWKWVWKNWIENTEFDPKLKSELEKLVEEYDELEKLIKKYSQLYNKAQRKKLSQAEKNKLKMLIKALQKLNPIKIELFLSVREIKRYLEEQYYQNDFWNEPRVNRIRRYFFTYLLKQYKSLKEAQKMKIIEKILKNWIENASEEELSLRLKALLKEILENYNQLEKLAIIFMELYKKEHLEQISQSEKVELKALIKTLEKLDPANIVLFANIRAIKRYLNDQHLDNLSDKSHMNRILNHFFTLLSEANVLLVKTYDRMSPRVQVKKSQLKHIYSELKEEGFTLDTISQKIGCSFRNSLYRGCSLNPDSFNKLQDLYGKKILHKIKAPIVPQINIEINEDLAELIGIILGDGHLSKSGNTLTITLNFAEEQNYVEYVKKLLRRILSIEPSIVELPDNKANQIRIYGKGIINAFVKVGMKTGNKVKNQVGVPNWIKNKKEFCASCLKGLLDTDGSIFLTSDKKRIAMNFKNNSKPLVESFKEMCKKLAIKTSEIYEGWTYSRGKRFRHYKVGIFKQSQIKRFILIVNPEKWINRKAKFIVILTKKRSSWSSVYNDI